MQEEHHILTEVSACSDFVYRFFWKNLSWDPPKYSMIADSKNVPWAQNGGVFYFFKDFSSFLNKDESEKWITHSKMIRA